MAKHRLLIATDAWHPQVNGVVRTLDKTTEILRELGHTVEIIEPSKFPSLSVPFYPEIRLALARPDSLSRRVRRFRPTAVHIATEGPIGLQVRRICKSAGWDFTTSYHTRFPEYLRELAGIPERWAYQFLKWFHAPAATMMVATPSLEKELLERGFRAPIRRWSRGVDLSLFRPRPRQEGGYPKPVLLYVGRVSKEKGIDDFLKLDLPGTKLVVGDGPSRKDLQKRYPEAVFLGYRQGEELAECYAQADLFVFPSRTDTFGVVLIEALASGLPVAAYPVTGPLDVITDTRWGALDEDLGRAVGQALIHADRAACAAEGARYTWKNCTEQFLANLNPVRPTSFSASSFSASYPT